ncbi:ribosome biogenesis protein bms1-like [Papaver somniferum]|uniref:ribosome biogenesis protein bms1-like n=1 Tax=Papaver somniferum TaxID=3469 RepID=UPI000E6FD687|nr:ribosome biogenesis protein bms1-like [Papaver somniferum]XP_026411521.1 ribosome biogenesis protein bms1-like [Papaver somniferum]
MGSGNRRRIQFVECPNNMNGMTDAAKYADAVMLLIDTKYGFAAKYGFEMETFEFLNLLQVHGTPKVMGVLTYLDKLKDENRRETTKMRLMQKFREQNYIRSLFHLVGEGSISDFSKSICTRLP